MTEIDLNIERNKTHFDKQLSEVNLEAIKKKVENYEDFFADATKTDAGWVGFYYGGFREKLRGTRVLDLGCGRGLNTLLMAKFGAEVVAIDISEESPRIINQLSKELGLSDKVTAYAGDFRELSFAPRSFDFIVGQAFLHHLVDELEDEILSKTSRLLKLQGEARFVEPAVNSKLLDQIRWLIPVPHRPSILQKNSFSRWKANDSHPVRDNSSKHYIQVGKKYFEEAEIIPYGGIDRLYRFLPRTDFTREFRRWAFHLERRLPGALNMKIARVQTILYKKPRNTLV